MDPTANPAAPPADPTPAAPVDPAAPEAPAEPVAPQEVTDVAPSLEQVHIANINKLDNEPEPEPEAPEPEPAAEPEPVPEPAVEPEPAPVPPEPAPERPEPAVLNTDTSVNAPGKIAVQSFDGKTYYFNNASEVPGDFEPLNFAETLKANEAFVTKAQKDAADAAKAEEDDAKTAQAQHEQQMVTALHQSWDADIAAMNKDGRLPADPKQNEAARQEVFDYMQKQVNAGISADNFQEAWKAVQYEKLDAKATAEQKKQDDAKKAAGGMVQPGGAPEPAEGKSRILKAPPSGVGLDAVHNRYTTNLN